MTEKAELTGVFARIHSCGCPHRAVVRLSAVVRLDADAHLDIAAPHCTVARFSRDFSLCA